MKALVLAALALSLTTTAQAKEFKIVGHEFMPIVGAGKGGKLDGAFAEITEEVVCKRLKYDCKWEIHTIPRGTDLMKDGTVHMQLGVSQNPLRVQFMNFAPLMTASAYTFFAKKGKGASFTKPEDTIGKKIGVYGPSATSLSLDKVNEKLGKKLTIETETNNDLAMKKLAGGRYGDDGLIYVSKPTGLYGAKTMSLDIEPVAFDVEVNNHTAGLSKKSVPADEYKKIWDAYTEFLKTPEAKKIIEKWSLKAYDGPQEMTK